MQKRRKQKTAVALSYHPEKRTAPQIVAKGKGLFAEKIIAIARENGVEIHEEANLAEALFSLEIEREIPVELYDSVAAVLAFIFQKHRAMKSR